MFAINAGHRVFYTTAGHSGPWVMFSHSLCCDHSMWEPQIERLASRYRVIAYDTRGHGASDPWASPFTLDDLAAEAIAVLDAAGVDRAHFVGLSMGGMIGQTMAFSYPNRIASLVLANTTSRFPPEVEAVWSARIDTVRREGMEAVVKPTLERWFTAPFAATHPGLMARIGQLIRRTSAAGYTGCARAICTLDISARLGAIECPVLAISGRQDPSTTLAMHEDIVRGIKGAKLAVLDPSAHLSNFEQTQAFNEAMEGFLDSVSQQSQ
jgi:3-oxoadipate enol-lactonase